MHRWQYEKINECISVSLDAKRLFEKQSDLNLKHHYTFFSV